MRKLIALVAVASLFVWSSPAQAQRSPYRDAWWGSFNVGPGWNSSDNLEGDRLTPVDAVEFGPLVSAEDHGVVVDEVVHGEDVRLSVDGDGEAPDVTRTQ